MRTLLLYGDHVQGVLNKVYPTLKVNIQNFLMTKVVKHIQILKLNECDFDNYPFFPLITFLGEIIKLYLQ